MIIDSNILVYSLNADSPKHQVAQEFLVENEAKISVTQQNVFETIRVITHPQFPIVYSSVEAVSAMGEILAHIRLLHPTLQTTQIAFNLIEKYKVTGNEVFDAYLVATALSNGVKKIATDNVIHLGKYQEISVVNPFI